MAVDKDGLRDNLAQLGKHGSCMTKKDDLNDSCLLSSKQHRVIIKIDFSSKHPKAQLIPQAINADIQKEQALEAQK